MAVRGFDPVQYLEFFLLCMCLHKNTVQALLLYSWIKKFAQKNIKNCTLISHFASASGGLCLPDPLPGISPDPLAPPLLHNPPYKSTPGSAPDSAGGSLQRFPRLSSWWGGGWLPPPQEPHLRPWPFGLRPFGPEYSAHRASIVHPPWLWRYPHGSRGARINTAYTDADITIASW